MEGSNPYANIIEIAEKAKKMTNVDDAIKFIESENDKLAYPYDKTELDGLINRVAIHIRQTQTKFNFDVCLEAMHAVVPDPNPEVRFRQARTFLENQMLTKTGEITEMQLFVDNRLFEYFKFEVNDKFGKILKKFCTEKINEKKKEQKTSNISPIETESENFTFPFDIMDKQTGRNTVYHTLANIYIKNHIVKCVNGKLRTYVDGIYPDSDENIDFVKSDVMRSGIEHGVNLSDNDLKNVIKVIENLTRVKTEDCEPNKDNVIVVNNGILDIKTWILEDFTPEKVYFSKLPVDYIPDAPKPEKFMKYMDMAFRNNSEQALLLQELTGFTLLKNYKYQAYFYLLGSGGEGKGTYLEILRYMLGEHNVSAASLHQLSDHPNLDYHVAKLYGRHANICGDAGFKKMENTETLKKLTSNTDPVTARNVRERPFDFINYAKVIIAMNRLAQTNAFTLGDRRRCVIINFENKIRLGTKDEIKAYGEHVKKAGELPGVLNWAIEGLKRLEEQQGFTDSRTIAQKTLEYERKSRPVRYFVEENLEESQGSIIPNVMLYERLSRFTQKNKSAELSPDEIKQEIIRECTEAGWTVTNKLSRFSSLPRDIQGALKAIGHDKASLRCFYGIKFIDETAPTQEKIPDIDPMFSNMKGMITDIIRFKESHPVYKHIVSDRTEFATDMHDWYPMYPVDEITVAVELLQNHRWRPPFEIHA